MPSRHPVGLAAGGKTSSHLRPGSREGQELSRLPSGTRDLRQTGRPHVHEAGVGEDAQRPRGAAVGPGCPTPGTSVPGQDPRREVSPGQDGQGRGDSCEGQGPPTRPGPQGRGGRGRRDPEPFPAVGAGPGRGPSRAPSPPAGRTQSLCAWGSSWLRHRELFSAPLLVWLRKCAWELALYAGERAKWRGPEQQESWPPPPPWTS